MKKWQISKQSHLVVVVVVFLYLSVILPMNFEHLFVKSKKKYKPFCGLEESCAKSEKIPQVMQFESAPDWSATNLKIK